MKTNKVFFMVLLGMQYLATAQETIKPEKVNFWQERDADIYQQGNLVAYRWKGSNNYDAFEYAGKLGLTRKMLPNGKECFDQLKKEFSLQYEPHEDFLKEKNPREFSTVTTPKFSFEREPSENENN